jgi:hypothetical protein
MLIKSHLAFPFLWCGTRCGRVPLLSPWLAGIAHHALPPRRRLLTTAAVEGGSIEKRPVKGKIGENLSRDSRLTPVEAAILGTGPALATMRRSAKHRGGE